MFSCLDDNSNDEDNFTTVSLLMLSSNNHGHVYIMYNNQL